MNNKFSEEEIGSVESVISHIEQGDIAAGIAELENLKNKIYASIADKKRISRGITWVLKRISAMIEISNATVARKPPLMIFLSVVIGISPPPSVRSIINQSL